MFFSGTFSAKSDGEADKENRPMRQNTLEDVDDDLVVSSLMDRLRLDTSVLSSVPDTDPFASDTSLTYA